MGNRSSSSANPLDLPKKIDSLIDVYDEKDNLWREGQVTAYDSFLGAKSLTVVLDGPWT